MTRTTIIDVANAAGVSIKTVSRVINREPNVRSAMKDKVEAAIKALGFVPNAAARSLAGSRSYVIGTIFDNPSPSYIVSLQRGAMKACRDAGYHLTIEEINLAAGQVAQQMAQMLETSRMDGVLLSPPVTDCEPVLEALEAKNIPYVRLTPAGYAGRSHEVMSDDAAAAGEIARHLWDLGHRRLAVVAGPATHGASKLRLDGFIAGIVAMGGDAKQVRVAQGDFSFKSGMVAGRKLLGAKNRPTAIFASNDDMAAGVFSAASQLELKIPVDVSVAGYDDSAIAELVWPSLTTVRQPIIDMAAEAARMLIERRGGETPHSIRMPYRVIIRQSTGPA
ncbi:LacI family DNA-binding transcriptional regulator [Govanella unica]|uniref:LacI family DNA-binding transcriptional regulator n=1 Tax=Govanella unica TaxID=2975056 RepID=A0A9X3TYC6_9PROT|nr:LacI family DNA-binding transcriptional regulator [Govania unica]